MGAIKVPTNFNIELEFEVPEFFKRLLSTVIDMVVQYFYIRIALEIYKSLYSYDDPLGGIGMLLFLPIMLYHLALEISLNGQSIGKKIMGLRVVDEFGGKPSISQFLIRWLLRVSDLWIVILLLIVLSGMAGGNMEQMFIVIFGLCFLTADIVLVVASKKGQRIGDLLAKTILISVRTRSFIEETVFQEVADSYVPSFPQIMQLSDKDINAIKSILETARKKGDYNMAEAASAKIKSHLKIESGMPGFDFLEVLLKDYNYLSVK